jgi:hypothetical protein
MPAYTLRPPHHAVITERAGHSLVIQGWAGDKPCLMTVDTGAYATVARAERQPNQCYMLQMVS